MLTCPPPRVCWHCVGSPDVAPPRAGVCAKVRPTRVDGRCAPSVDHVTRVDSPGPESPCRARDTPEPWKQRRVPARARARTPPGPTPSADAPSHPDAAASSARGGTGTRAAATRASGPPRERCRLRDDEHRPGRAHGDHGVRTVDRPARARQTDPAPAARVKHARRCPRRDEVEPRSTAGAWPATGTTVALPGSKGIRRLTAPRPHRPHHVGTRDHDVGYSRRVPPVTRSRPDLATVCGDDLPAGDKDRPAGSVAPPVPPR